MKGEKIQNVAIIVNQSIEIGYRGVIVYNPASPTYAPHDL
jgi:hypothetical protein